MHAKHLANTLSFLVLIQRNIGDKHRPCGRTRPTNDMVMRKLQANAVKTSMPPGNTSDIVFLNELKPSDVRGASFFYIRKSIPRAHVAEQLPHVRPTNQAPLVVICMNAFRSHCASSMDLTVAVGSLDRYRLCGVPWRGLHHSHLILDLKS